MMSHVVVENKAADSSQLTSVVEVQSGFVTCSDVTAVTFKADVVE